MARYFRYKSPEEVVADADSLGESLAMSDDLSPLFQPLAIGHLKVGGRLAIHPMEGCDGTLDGNPDELTFRRYQRFGAGGAKLIWGEAAAVCPEGRANTRQLQVAEHTVKGLERMLTICREAHAETMGSTDGLVVGLQRRASGGVLAPILTHCTWSISMLFVLPLLFA